MVLPAPEIKNLVEAEIQLLIAMIELIEPKETDNNNFYSFYPADLEQAGTYFRKFREDWAGAHRTLVAKQLLAAHGSGFRLTPSGRVAAAFWRDEHPPIWYWYKEFHTDAPSSPTYRKFCETLYGKYLCQQGFSPMQQINVMLELAGLGPAERALELGCGIGLLTEHVSDATGATLHGIDYAPDAIIQAQERTVAKRHRLTFEVGDMDSLAGRPRSFDTVLSIDSFYMPRDLAQTLTRVRDLLVPDGQLLAFYLTFSSPGLPPDRTPLAVALRKTGFAVRTYDFSKETYQLMQRKRALADELREDFTAEGRSYLYDHLVTESVDPAVPFDAEKVGIRRYLYHAKIV